MRNWVLGSVTSVMALGGLFVASHVGYGVAYYGGLLYFAFAVLFVFLLIKVSFDEAGGETALAEFRKLFARSMVIMFPASTVGQPDHIDVHKIGVADLWEALGKGIADFRAHPTHLIILCFLYPFGGLFIARMTAGYEILPILFPLVSGFALIGPLAATGLYELSMRQEQGLPVSWWHVIYVFRSPSIYSIAALGVIMAVIFFAWLAAAQAIYEASFGLWTPASLGDFIHQVFTTPSGWKLIIVGYGVGFLFAVVVLTISVVSLPMLLDRKVGVTKAIHTSVRAVFANPKTMAIWGLFVATTLAIGSLPAFTGLAIVVPVLGHTTWHLYRKLVAY